MGWQGENNKQRQNDQSIIHVIKYEGDKDIFVWKHPIEDFNLGSQLIVHESQEALFFRDGKALDLFGAGRHTLVTQNLPLLEKIYQLPVDGSEVFHAEVYFINMTTQMGVKWGTDSRIRLFDPTSGLYIELGASGTFNIRVTDSRKLIVKVVGNASEFSSEDINGAGYSTSYMQGKFRSLILNRIKAHLARTVKELEINILEIDSYLDELSERMQKILNETLDKYGLEMTEFFITTVALPDEDPNFRRLKQQFADRTLLIRQEEILKAEAEAARQRKMVEAQTEANIKEIQAQGDAKAIKIQAEAKAEGYKMQALAEAEEMHAKGYTYQQETARQVGLEAMQNGLIGNGSGEGGGSGLGDIASLGVTLGAMGEILGMTKDALKPIMGQSSEIGQNMGNVVAGREEMSSSGQCYGGMPTGTQATAEPDQSSGVKKEVWSCSCGATGLTSRFCPDCGRPRIPEDNEEE